MVMAYDEAHKSEWFHRVISNWREVGYFLSGLVSLNKQCVPSEFISLLPIKFPV